MRRTRNQISHVIKKILFGSTEMFHFDFFFKCKLSKIKQKYIFQSKLKIANETVIISIFFKYSFKSIKNNHDTSLSEGKNLF